MERNKKVTLQEIADIVGVSKGTVDRAIHNRSEINEETKRKILKVATELNYTPNRAARSLALKEKKKIGVIIRSKPSFFWDRVQQGILDANKELEDYGIEVILRNQELMSDFQEQLELIDELLDQSLNAMILVPVNTPSIAKKIHEVVGKGIVVSTLNDDIESNERLFYLGPHMQQSGRVAAELIGKFLREKGNIITINGGLKSYSYKQRLDSFRNLINQRYPDIQVIANYDYNHTKSEPYNSNIIKEIIKNIPNLNGIYNVDGASLYETGCILREIGKQSDITLVGHEIWSKVAELLNQDIIDAVINQDPYVQGYYAVKLLYHYLIEGKDLNFKEYYTHTDIIISENLPISKNTINFINDFEF